MARRWRSVEVGGPGAPSAAEASILAKIMMDGMAERGVSGQASAKKVTGGTDCHRGQDEKLGLFLTDAGMKSASETEQNGWAHDHNHEINVCQGRHGAADPEDNSDERLGVNQAEFQL
jgi:hypothetical protein